MVDTISIAVLGGLGVCEVAEERASGVIRYRPNAPSSLGASRPQTCVSEVYDDDACLSSIQIHDKHSHHFSGPRMRAGSAEIEQVKYVRPACALNA